VRAGGAFGNLARAEILEINGIPIATIDLATLRSYEKPLLPFTVERSLLLQDENSQSVVMTPLPSDPFFDPDFRVRATVRADVYYTVSLAINAIPRWRQTMGRMGYLDASRLLIIADCGDSNGAR
jgi:hypothetical protein